MAIEPTDTNTKKPAARRRTRRATATDAAPAAIAKASGARKTVAPRAPAATRKATTPSATAPRKSSASSASAKKVDAAKAVVASAPHNAGVAAEAAVKKVKQAARKSPVGLKTAIAAGIGTVGAVATAALLTLRSSTPRADDKSKSPPRK